jgi:serine/threonine protein kinase
MGVVYRAHDEVLHRDVALKALSEPVIERLGKEHLLHEARSSSALNHPNICTVHGIVEDDGTLHIAMELVEGKSLSELIGDSGLPVESVLHYGAQIAAALSHAHGRRIVQPFSAMPWRPTVSIRRASTLGHAAARFSDPVTKGRIGNV